MYSVVFPIWYYSGFLGMVSKMGQVVAPLSPEWFGIQLQKVTFWLFFLQWTNTFLGGLNELGSQSHTPSYMIHMSSIDIMTQTHHPEMGCLFAVTVAHGRNFSLFCLSEPQCERNLDDLIESLAAHSDTSPELVAPAEDDQSGVVKEEEPVHHQQHPESKDEYSATDAEEEDMPSLDDSCETNIEDMGLAQSIPEEMPTTGLRRRNRLEWTGKKGVVLNCTWIKPYMYFLILNGTTAVCSIMLLLLARSWIRKGSYQCERILSKVVCDKGIFLCHPLKHSRSLARPMCMVRAYSWQMKSPEA